MTPRAESPTAAASTTALAVFLAFLKLGLISFGGPIAHLGYFQREFVLRRRWLDDAAYADLVALCQFLPGPASSQVGIALGAMRAGVSGAIAAWLGFTLPSALIMIAFAYGVDLLPGAAGSGWIHGLKIAAVAVVAQAVWTMAQRLCPDRLRAMLAVIAAVLVLSVASAAAQLLAIAFGALAGWRWLPHSAPAAAGDDANFHIGRRLGASAWVLSFALLLALPVLSIAIDSHAMSLFDRFYRAGALVFGGGHVVLPLLRGATVPDGWLSDSSFLAGYGAAQALPGPLFAFAAYLGSAARDAPNGWPGGLLALAAIYLPAFLLVLGALPYWRRLRQRADLRAALNGINAAVVGILIAALYNPIFISSVQTAADFALALALFALLVWWRLPPLAAVVFAAAGGTLFTVL